MTAEATVILVNVDAPTTEFYGFAQKQALDLIGADPRVWIWTADADGRVPHTIAREALGRWPRLVAQDALADTLAEAVITTLDAGGKIAVILLARSPASLMPGSGDRLPLLGPLAQAIERSHRSSLWLICASLEGPHARIAAARQAIARPLGALDRVSDGVAATGVDTVVFLNRQRDAVARISDLEPSAGLRLLIDIARDRDAGKTLRPGSGPQPGLPRILWLRVPAPLPPIRPLLLRRAVTAVIEEKLAAAYDPNAETQDTLRAGMDRFLAEQKARPEDASPAVAPQPDLIAVLDERSPYRDGAVASIGMAGEALSRHYAERYDSEIGRIRGDQTRRDRSYAVRREEILRHIPAIDDAGLSGHGTEKVEEEAERLERERDGWREAARAARTAALSLHQDVQDRSDPTSPGIIDLAAFAEGRHLSHALDVAAEAAADLPTSPSDWLWVLVPVLVPLAVIGAHVAARGTFRLAVVTPFGLDFVFALIVLSLAAFVRHEYRKRFRHAATLARDAAQAVTGALNAALGNIQLFIANSRAALLADHLASTLRRRLARAGHVQFRHDYEQLKDRIVTPEEPLAEKTRSALVTVTKTHPVEGWMQAMIRAWNAAEPPEAVASLSLEGSGAAHDLEIAENATGTKPLAIPSSWSAGPFAATAIPLAATARVDPADRAGAAG